MAKKMKKELEERLREVIKSKIRRLREAPVMPDEEEDDEFQQTSAPDVKRSKPAPVDGNDSQAPQAPVEPSKAGFSSEPSASPDVAPSEVPPEPTSPEVPAMDEPAADAPESGDEKIRQAKVRLFFDKMAANPTLMNLLKFTSPLEQAEAIHQFATMVGVPKSQVLPLLKQIKDTSMEPETDPNPVERVTRRRR
jgi:hypothetical protein